MGTPPPAALAPTTAHALGEGERVIHMYNLKGHRGLAPPLERLPLLDDLAPTLSRVSCGRSHALLLTSPDGAVYALGDGAGLGVEEQWFEPKHLESSMFGGEKAIDIACGANHCCVVTESGTVYTWGKGSQGELGHGSTRDCPTPTLVKALKPYKVVKARAGLAHTVVLTDKGNVYTFGRGLEGQLGHGNLELQTSPHIVKKLFGTSIAQIRCGYSCSVFISKLGVVYVTGEGTTGQLGCGTRRLTTPERLQIDAPVKELSQDVLKKHTQGLSVPLKIVDGSVGWGHSIFLSDTGEVYGCGLNSKLQVGVGHSGSKHKRPVKVDVVLNVNAIAPDALLKERIEEVAESDLDDDSQDMSASIGTPSMANDESDAMGPASTKDTVVERPTPVALAGAPLQSVHCGDFYSCAVTVGGVLVLWGSGNGYSSGITTNMNQFLPPHSTVLRAFPTKEGLWVVVEEFVQFVKYHVHVGIESLGDVKWATIGLSLKDALESHTSSTSNIKGVVEWQVHVVLEYPELSSLIKELPEDVNFSSILRQLITGDKSTEGVFLHEINSHEWQLTFYSTEEQNDLRRKLINGVTVNYNGAIINVNTEKSYQTGVVAISAGGHLLPSLEELINQQFPSSEGACFITAVEAVA